MKENDIVKDLLTRIAKHSDKSAFALLYKRYHAKLINFALYFLPSYQDAEDVVSEVVIKLLKNKHKLGEIENFEGYLYQVIKNQALNHKKKGLRDRQIFQQILPEDVQTATYVQPIHKILEDELRTIITNTVEALPPQRKLVYKLMKDDCLKTKEVAQLLGLAEKTVKKHLELAIKDVRQAINNYQADKKDIVRVLPLKKRYPYMLALILQLF